MVGQAPVLGFAGVHPAAGHQELDGDVVGDAPPQFDGAGVREHADVYFGQRELRVLLHHDDIRPQHDLEAPAAGDAVDRGDEGLVEVARVVQAAESARTPVLVGLLAAGGALEVPPRAEEALTGARHDRNPQGRVVTERGERLVQAPARRQVDGVRLRTVDGHLENRTVGCGADAVGHVSVPPGGSMRRLPRRRARPGAR